MTIEDTIRRIVREEIERRFPQPAPEPLQTWRDLLNGPSCCPRGCKPGTLCGDVTCPLRVSTVMYDPSKSVSGTAYGPITAGVVGGEVVLKHLDNVQRTGCTCPPTSPVSACPDPTCPWKPR